MGDLIKIALGTTFTLSLIIYVMLASRLGWNPADWREQIEREQQTARETYLNQCAAALQEIDNDEG